MTALQTGLLTLSLIALLAGCATAPPAPDVRTTDQVVTQTSGRKISINDNVRSGLQFAIAPIANRCQREGGALLDFRINVVQFYDRRGSQGPRSVSLPSRVVCKVGDRSAWGADLRVSEAQYLVASSIGDGVNYYGTVLAGYVPPEQLQAEGERQAADRASEQRARETQMRECAALREAYTKRVQSNPVPGMKVGFGMIIEVRGAIALVQYDTLGRQVKQKDQEWVPVSSLGPGEDCPR